MNILFYFGHPAQYLFVRDTIKRLSQSNRHQIRILIKTKDVLEDLLRNDGMEYTNILPQIRGNSRASIVLSLIKRTFSMLPIVLKFKPDLLIGTDATIAQLGKVLNINRITITEDDYEAIKNLGDLAYPFTQTILCPSVCDVGKWDTKKVGYDGYMKLGYLHPAVFTVNNDVLKKYGLVKKYILIRLSQLNAHHDFGIKGLNETLLDTTIEMAEGAGYQVFVSAEGGGDDKYEKYQLSINPNDMHHVLANAQVLICDSQSMTMEAAMLGVPSLRYSSFVGKISVLEELEHTYQLTVGIAQGDDAQLMKHLYCMLSDKDIKEKYQAKREKMLADKIDVTAFMVWFIENYPLSKNQMKEDPAIQNQFKKLKV